MGLLQLNNRTWRNIWYAAVAMLSLPIALYAQGGRSGDALLYPQAELPLHIGLEAGYGFWNNEADFAVCDNGRECARFIDGDGSGPVGGVKAYIYLTEWFFASPRVRYEARSGTFMTDLPSEPVRDQNMEIVMLDQEGEVDVTMATITFDLMFGIDIASTGLYVMAGPSASLLQDGQYDYTERITGPEGFVYGDTETNEQLLANGRSFETYQSYALDLRAGLGYILRFGELAVNPEFFYSFPLTSSLDTPDLLKQTGYVGTIGLLLNIGD